MKIKKRLVSLSVVVLSFSYLFPSAMAASNITDAAYTAGIHANNSATETIVNATALLQLDAEILKDQYYTNSSLTGVAMRDANNHDIYFMPPVSSESIDWTVYVPSIIPGNEDWKMYLSQENMNPSITLFPGTDGVRAVTSSTLDIGPDTASWDVELNGIVLNDNTEDPLLTVGDQPLYTDKLILPGNFPAIDIADSTYGDGYYFAVVKNSNILYRSNDGINWEQLQLPVSQNWISMCYGNELVLVGEGAKGYFSCDYGITWNTFNMPRTSLVEPKILFGGNNYIMSLKQGTTWYAYCSSNLTSWETLNSANNVNKIIIGAYDDGIVWIDSGRHITCRSNDNVKNLISLDGYYINNSYCLSSNDAAYFYINLASGVTRCYKVTYDNFTLISSSTPVPSFLNLSAKTNNVNNYIVVTHGDNNVQYSTDAINWETLNAPVNTNNFIYGYGKYLILGNNTLNSSYISDYINSGYVNGDIILHSKLTGPSIKFNYVNGNLSIYNNDQLVINNPFSINQSTAYQFTSSATTIKVDKIKVKVDGETVADWSWNPDGVLLDASGNGNNATTDYAAAYDPNITLSIQSINPIKVSAAEDGSDDSGGVNIINPEDDPIVIPDAKPENWDKIPLFKDLAKDINHEGWPVDLILSMLVVLLDMIICFILYKFTRNQLTSGVIAIVFLGYFTVMGCIPIFALVVSIIAELAVMTKRKVISY